MYYNILFFDTNLQKKVYFLAFEKRKITLFIVCLLVCWSTNTNLWQNDTHKLIPPCFVSDFKLNNEIVEQEDEFKATACLSFKGKMEIRFHLVELPL